MTMHDAPTHRHDASHSPCARFRAVLSGYLDGMLTREEHRAADEHLEACLECRSIVDESERLDRSLAAMIDDAAADPLPEGFAGAVLARTAHAERCPSPVRPSWSYDRGPVLDASAAPDGETAHPPRPAGRPTSGGGRLV